eukprot:TRINITY_DN7383_c0_g1_i1.p1 TRINITY_DN7383_c0_g1~~TRINITY_DN7383_c0_g1_i1.p1  ORF type:complete len:163 (+),score=67.08 TRINITY_DN7383_c0_g1_i1:39-491(+)
MKITEREHSALGNDVSSKVSEDLQALLQRGLQALPKRKHIKLISRFGMMEFRNGSPERGRTLLEGILTNYPKKLDIWSVYLDLEIKLGDKKKIRNLFERLTSLNMSTKKMKFVFKKYLTWEKKNGSEAEVEKVKQKAIEYIDSKTSKLVK